MLSPAGLVGFTAGRRLQKLSSGDGDLQEYLRNAKHVCDGFQIISIT